MNIYIHYKYDFDASLRFKIVEAVDWLCKVLVSDEFKWKARKFKDRDLFLENVDGFTFGFDRLFPETGTNAKYPALYDKDHSDVLINSRTAPYYTKKALAAVLGHEFTHEWIDHDEFDINSFPYFIQSEVKNMAGKSNMYLKTLIWLYERPVIKWSLIGALIVTVILMTLLWK